MIISCYYSIYLILNGLKTSKQLKCTANLHLASSYQHPSLRGLDIGMNLDQIMWRKKGEEIALTQ